MKRIKPSKNIPQFPNKEVKSVECRKRDLVIRISDWTRDREEPAFDVEVYVGGVYSFDESKVFSTQEIGKELAKIRVNNFVTDQVRKFL